MLSAEDKPGIVHAGDAPFDAGVVVALRRMATHHSPLVTKAGERHIARLPGAPGAGHAVDRIDFGMPVLQALRTQEVFALQPADGQRIGLEGKQVNHRHTVQAQAACADG